MAWHILYTNIYNLNTFKYIYIYIYIAKVDKVN